MKKILCALGAMAASLPLFAAEGDVDFSAATTALTSVKTALVGWAGTAMPLFVAIASAFLVFWLGKLIFRMVKGWANSSK